MACINIRNVDLRSGIGSQKNRCSGGEEGKDDNRVFGVPSPCPMLPFRQGKHAFTLMLVGVDRRLPAFGFYVHFE